jgi:site-specific DNA-methyltransferase (adenine-specific)
MTDNSYDLILGDCVTGMAKLPGESIDLVVTSPPYNLGKDYNQRYDDGQVREQYLIWCSRWAAQVKRVMHRDSSFFLNIGSAPANPLLPFQIVSELTGIRGVRFVLQNVIHWVKSIAIADRSYGHFKPINSHRFLNDCHEYVFHFTRTGRVEIERLALGVPYQDKSNISRWSHTGGSDLRCRGNTWFVPYETIQNREKERPHPATFPVQLPAWCIKLHGAKKVHRMLDPFLGIGNSAVAARRCGVPEFIGFEIVESYLVEARRRLWRAEQSASALSKDE